jgi:hypothetical protein
MTNPISKAGKKLFAQDPDVRQYAAADTAYEEGEYVPVQQEGENADRRKVRSLAYFSIHSFFPLQFGPPTPSCTCTPIHSMIFLLAFQKEMRPFCTL